MGVVSSAVGVREASWRRRNESGSLRIICHIERRVFETKEPAPTKAWGENYSRARTWESSNLTKYMCVFGAWTSQAHERP